MNLGKTPFGNVQKEENAGNQYSLLFPMFSTFPNTNFSFLVTFILLSASSFNLGQSKNKSFGKGLFIPFPNKPLFSRVCSTSLLKTLWEKEKLLVTSNFSLSRSVFYMFEERSAIFIKSEIVVCKLFQFGRV